MRRVFVSSRWNPLHYGCFTVALMVLTLGSITFFNRNRELFQMNPVDTNEVNTNYENTAAKEERITASKQHNVIIPKDLIEKYANLLLPSVDLSSNNQVPAKTDVDTSNTSTLGNTDKTDSGALSSDVSQKPAVAKEPLPKSKPVEQCPRLKRDRFAWYGPSVYHVIADENQSWTWVKTFLSSICRNCSTTENELVNQVLRRMNETTRSSYSSRQVVSISFPQAGRSAVEDKVASTVQTDSTQVSRTNLPRSFCNETYCRPARILPTRAVADVLLVSGTVEDFYDMTQIVACSLQAEFLVTSIQIEKKDDINNDRYSTMFYDFLNVLFFEYDWIPFASNEKRCDGPRFNCMIWVAWTKFRHNDRLDFFPPAGDGSMPYEIERLSSYFANPDQGACYRREHFGGTYDTETAEPKIDGRYTLCMDHFPKRSPDECLIYSFGIRSDWRFDDQMRSLNCSVVSFDPSIGMPSHRRAIHHNFYNWGLVVSPEHSLGISKLPTDWILKTVPQIRQELNHTHRRLDVLKMDCESPEMTFLDSVNVGETLQDVGQLAVEVHWIPSDWQVAPPDFDGAKVVWNMARIVHRLEKHGFVMFYSRPAPKWVGVDLIAYNRTVTQVTGAQAFVYEASFLNSAMFPEES